MSDRICVGAIAGSYGVKGEVRLKSFCADPEAIADFDPLFSEDGTQRYSVTLTHVVKNGFSAKINGVSNKEQAEKLRGIRLFADRDQLPELPDDEFYHADLIGLTVLDTGGNVLGRVKNVQNYGAGDLLEIEGSVLENTVLLPFTKEIVPTVDLAGGRIIADPPEGIYPE
ncbi:ribosome maturation factor RimM [Pseudohalocynthiibacter aestuariivivens]|jgi:16S rRNA processing protein RimM|uniref:Ribosome maturation factor RimM n=1 Tax=Pseudohalocynthiibacter aestuariivivens TaxID=1591409 RepID=A0ABV5JD69_9RHOB|nr:MULTISPECIES: ribosome maturation factor RimM [Pseudohalocynthiibacter]MBS9715607.1 16S rRNA processing protein RimM [Pseudohalocynthiibacter aestuariivivens]MCK0101221.1 ribosome maturation factor RimM [Pseudohalocynthiibacter sp. F2068]